MDRRSQVNDPSSQSTSFYDRPPQGQQYDQQIPGQYRGQGDFPTNQYGVQQYNQVVPRQREELTLSKEDRALLNEWNREAFYYRSLPGMAIGASLVWYLNMRKPMKAFMPKLFGSMFAGWFIGKLSYHSKYYDKLLNARHRSPFIDRVRQQAGLPPLDSDDLGYREGGLELEDDISKSSPWINPDAVPKLQDDDEVPTNESRRSVTYDELRARNRASFQDRSQFPEGPPFDRNADSGGQFRRF